MGDPTGIGPEIIVKALTREEPFQACRPVVFGDPGVLLKTIKCLGQGGLNGGCPPDSGRRLLVPENLSLPHKPARCRDPPDRETGSDMRGGHGECDSQGSRVCVGGKDSRDHDMPDQ